MSNDNLKQRTQKFALSLIQLVGTLPNDRTSNVLGGQLLRAGKSVGANYRAACRAKSPADSISKMGTVEEEADESVYWLELLVAAGRLTLDKAAPIIGEANELTTIVASIRTARKSNSRPPTSSVPHSALRTPHSQPSALRTPHSALQ